MTGPNLILIGVDTLRRDHLGCYGYGAPVSPNIDRLASEGTLYENVYVNHYPTSPSFTTLLTGVDGIEHDIVCHGGKRLLSPKIPLLSERLKAAGYTTLAIDNMVSLARAPSPWCARGFDYYYGFHYKPNYRQDPGAQQGTTLTNRACDLIERFKQDRFFLFVHYWDPHVPYWPPTGERPLSERGPSVKGEPSLRERFLQDGDENSSLLLGSMRMNDVTDYQWIVDQYDESIRFVDRQIGRILTRLDELGLAQDTMMVVLADHGECFGELGVHFDHRGPADANIRVPLVIRHPGSVPAGKRVSELVQTVDISATLLQAAGLGGAPGIMGHGLLDSAPQRGMVISAEAWRQAAWIARTSEWKLVVPTADPRTGKPHEDYLGRAPASAAPVLYDMRGGQDGVDASKTHPEVLDRLTREFQSWLRERLAGRPDPVAEQGPAWPWARMRSKILEVISMGQEESSWANPTPRRPGTA